MTMSVFLVPKTEFFYSPGKGIQEQTAMPVGHARVSIMDRNPALQTDALMDAGCGRIFADSCVKATRSWSGSFPSWRGRPRRSSGDQQNPNGAASRSGCCRGTSTRARPKADNRRGRRSGRPWAIDERSIRQAEAMLRDTGNPPFIGDVIDQLGTGRTAFHRYFPPERIRSLRNGHADGVPS